MQPDLFTCFPLRECRVHEVFGAGAFAFSAIATASARDHVLWIRESWLSDSLNPVGLSPFCDPSLYLQVRSRNQTDSLAVAEEALKDGSVSFVVLEITRPLDLREGRRLQLAAKAGGTTGLCMIPEGMGSNSAETRWRATPVFDPDREDSTLASWEITKNKSGTVGAWHVRWDRTARRLHVVSPAGQRPGSEVAPG